MTCSKCGAALADNSRFCANCGNPLQDQLPGQPAVPPPVASLPFAPLPPAPAAVVAQETSGKAIASLVCGIVNIFPFCVVAIILGHISLSQIGKSAGRLKGRGLAIAGLILGYLGLVAIPFILIIAAIAIPNLLRARMAADEASAAGSVRNLISAEINYQTTNPKAGFTCKLSDLRSAGLIDSGLASGQKYGYVFTLQNCGADNEGDPFSRFQITAAPATPNSSGVRAFCADESAIVWVDDTGSVKKCLKQGAPLQ